MPKYVWVILAVVAVLTGIIVYNKIIKAKKTEQAAAAASASQSKDIQVSGFIAQPKTLDNDIVASGTLLANEQINLQSEIAGKIVVLNLTEGTTVAKGALLVKLFDEDLQAQLKKLQAQEETAEKTQQRMKQLLAINGVGQQDFDNAETTLKGIKADEDYTKAQISKTEIRAPFDGMVGLRNVSLGAYLSPTMIIATLQQINPLKIDFTVPEKYSTLLNKGDDIMLTVDGLKDKFKGKVYAQEPQLDEATRSMKVRGLVQNSNSKLFPGTYAKVDLGLKRIENAMMVPTQCIIPQARKKQIVLVKNGIAIFKDVETGVRNDTYIQITNGAVEAGDTIAATAIMYLKPNVGVKVNKIIAYDLKTQ